MLDWKAGDEIVALESQVHSGSLRHNMQQSIVKGKTYIVMGLNIRPDDQSLCVFISNEKCSCHRVPVAWDHYLFRKVQYDNDELVQEVLEDA